MRTLQDLLAEVEAAHQAYGRAISRARDPSLQSEEQRAFVVRARGAWVQLQAAHDKLCRYSVGSPNLKAVEDDPQHTA